MTGTKLEMPQRLRSRQQINLNDLELTSQQRARLRLTLLREFSRHRPQKPRVKVEEYIQFAAGYSPLFFHYNHEPTSAEARNQLTAVQKSADALTKALNKLFSEQGANNLFLTKADHMHAGTRSNEETTIRLKELQRESSRPPAPPDVALQRGGTEVMLQRLWLYASAASAIAASARQNLKLSRGARRDDQHTIRLLRYLEQNWYIVFNKNPSLRRGGQFHRVASAVGKVFGITVGGRLVQRLHP